MPRFTGPIAVFQRLINAGITVAATLLRNESDAPICLEGDQSVMAGKRRSSLPGTLAQKGLLIVGLPTALQLVFLGIIMVENGDLQQSTIHEAHYRRLLTVVGSMALESIQVCAQLNNLMTKPDKNALISVAGNLQKLEKQTKDLRAEAHVDEDTKKLCNDFAQTAEELQDIFKNSSHILIGGLNRDSACELFAYRKRFRDIVPVFLDQHQQLLQQSLRLSNKVTVAQQHRRAVERNWILGAALSCALLGVVIGNLFSREIRSRLAVIKDNTLLLGTGKELLPPIDGQDEIKQLDSTFREMALALEEAKEKERALVTESQDVICSLDRDARISLYNPATSTVLNARNPGGQALIDFIVPQYHESLRSALGLARETPQVVELATENGAGELLYLSAAINWSEPQQQYFVAAHDITRRKELERMQRELYAMIAHDVRSPLMSARAAIELSRLGVADPADRLRLAERSIDRVTHLIHDLLDMEKLQSGKFEICPDRAKCSEIIETALDSVHGLIDEKGLNLVTLVEDADLYADRELLSRVLFNLLSNAIKFSPAKAKLSLTCRITPGGVRFSVSDEGPGISDSDQQRLFQKFVQVGKENKRSGPLKGTGLGLAICKMVVDEHDGKIGVISEPGKGSEFWFIVPSVESFDEQQNLVQAQDVS